MARDESRVSHPASGARAALTEPLAASPGAITRIQPARGWIPIDLPEIWRYRELLYFLAWRDVKVRYKQTVLGAAWAILQPLFTMLVLTLFFGRLARVPSDGIPYPLFAYAALVPWMFFSGALTQSATSLLASANMISKVYFPRLVVPAGSVLAGSVDFLFAFAVLVAMALWFGYIPSASLWWLPLVLAVGLMASLGVAFWISALSAEFRDVRHVIPFTAQLWMFATPIAYPSSLLPQAWRGLYAMNPMVGVVEGFRWSMLGGPAPTAMLVPSALVAVVLFVSGAYFFRRVERAFADVL